MHTTMARFFYSGKDDDLIVQFLRQARRSIKARTSRYVSATNATRTAKRWRGLWAHNEASSIKRRRGRTIRRKRSNAVKETESRTDDDDHLESRRSSIIDRERENGKVSVEAIYAFFFLLRRYPPTRSFTSHLSCFQEQKLLFSLAPPSVRSNPYVNGAMMCEYARSCHSVHIWISPVCCWISRRTAIFVSIDSMRAAKKKKQLFSPKCCGDGKGRIGVFCGRWTNMAIVPRTRSLAQPLALHFFPGKWMQSLEYRSNAS